VSRRNSGRRATCRRGEATRDAQPGDDSNQQREQISDHRPLYRSGDTLRYRNLSCSVRGSAFLMRVSRQPSLIQFSQHFEPR